MVCDFTNNVKDACEIYLKKYNQKVLGSVFFFFSSDFSCNEQGYSSISDLTEKRSGGGGKLAWSIRRNKNKNLPTPPGSPHPELFAKLLVLSLEGHFSHPFTQQGKNIFHEANIF